ncbi:MAG: hypothetical protein CM1200mP4_4960 [Rhodospirillaceae bacterium]|nr:MAG: hypothetical protein CM1200mP4_4960 [Rhodospirillaceae bacterium]
MSWLTNFVRPKIRALVGPKRVREPLMGKVSRMRSDDISSRVR